MVGVARVALNTPNNTIIVSLVGAGTAKYHSGGANASGFSLSYRRGLSPTTSATSPKLGEGVSMVGGRTRSTTPSSWC